ncbi:hypothetical protein [Streptomyces sp. MNP-20]|uniref:hypothetical protein n=1 Tax=Streptomyces sp. MNP-20 TaxID=2721165 RepID=UPI001552B983|nr:hypothetical protein [Streptomyces sp. MNP-20]
MTHPHAEDLLFEMQAPPTPIERLLHLADLYTQHNDTLDLLLSASAEPSEPRLHATSAQHLATETLAALTAVHDQRPYESSELTDATARLRQLACLSTASASHDPYQARELTALAPEAVVASATVIAREARKRRGNTTAPATEHLTAAQEAALREVAQGYVVVTGSAERQYVHSRTTRVLISTLRSLEARNLIRRRTASARPAFYGGPPQDRVHLTRDGAAVLATSLTFPPAPAGSVSTAPRPVATTQAAARSR